MTKRKKRNPSRSLGVRLWDFGKDPFGTRNYPPGQHGITGYKKPTDYGIQLRAKQILKKYYSNITEKQFVRTYKEAQRRTGDTGQNLIGLLESRLDAFVCRAKLAPSFASARQIVNHKHVTVNGKVVNIPSYILKPQDVVQVREKSKEMKFINEAAQDSSRKVPEYISVDPEKLVAQYLRMPVLSDVPYGINMQPQLVIEYYSR